MTKVAFENMSKINQVIKVTKFTTLDNMNKLNGIDLHSGSLKYLKEQM